MDIPGISGGDSSLGGLTAYGSEELDKDAFLNLLVTQLENQDPLDPVANEDFVAQLATFSSLEQLEQVNEGLLAMITLNQSNALLSQLTQGSALIGKSVSWVNPDTGVETVGSVESIKIEEGIAFLNIDGEDIPLAYVSEVLGDEGAGTGDTDSSGDTTDA